MSKAPFVQQKAYDQFVTMYTSLLKTLSNIFDDVEAIRTEYKKWQKSDTQYRQQFIKLWYASFRPHAKLVHTESFAIFGANISVLLRIHIPHLWIAMRFTNTSKKHLWVYLKKLWQYSQEYSVRRTEQEGKNIAPPTTMNPNELLSLCSKLSPNILTKANKIAQNLATKMDGQNEDPSNMDIGQITQQLMADPQTQTLFTDLMREIQT
mgnify:CR=1 FL=1